MSYFNAKIVNNGVSNGVFEILSRLFKRKLEERGCEAGDGFTVSVAISNVLSEGSYIISKTADGVSFDAADSCAAFAALGRFLTEADFDGRGHFEVGFEKISHTPEKPLRGMYFATHFHNFYHDAPLDEINDIIDELAMYGINCLLVWFDMHHYCGIDAEAEIMIDRLRSIMSHAAEIGMPSSMITLANEGFKNSPAELRGSGDIQNGYFMKLDGYYGVEICPSKPGGMEEIMRERRMVLERFCDLPIKYLVFWPYDQGGCTCEKCTPWGTNGMLRILPEYKKLLSEMMPQTKIIFSTWYFDRFVAGEWDGIYDLLDRGIEGVDYVMSFFFNGNLPECIKQKGMPKNSKFIDFPEISMYSCMPWGGYGANPLSRFLDRTSAGSGDIYCGGYPYSEGIFEDINKFCTAANYSGLYKSAKDAVKAYVKLNFCCSDERLCDAVIKTETALERTRKVGDDKKLKVTMVDTSDIQYVYDVLSEYNSSLPEKITSGWRWRIIYLRAVIDRELLLCDGVPSRSAVCQDAFAELCRIYHASENTNRWVKPPVNT